MSVLGGIASVSILQERHYVVIDGRSVLVSSTKPEDQDQITEGHKWLNRLGTTKARHTAPPTKVVINAPGLTNVAHLTLPG